MNRRTKVSVVLVVILASFTAFVSLGYAQTGNDDDGPMAAVSPYFRGGHFSARVKGYLDGAPVQGYLEVYSHEGWDQVIRGWNADLVDGYSIGAYVPVTDPTPIMPTGYIPLTKGDETFRVFVVKE